MFKFSLLIILFFLPLAAATPTPPPKMPVPSCRTRLEGIPFQLPTAILRSLGDDAIYLPEAHGDSPIPGWVKQYFHGGKRLRPLMVYLSSLAMGKASKEVEKLAAIVELIHLGSLALDDIIDEATERRGRPPLYLAEGLTAGIITGPWLQAAVFDMAESATSSRVRLEMARVLKAMGDGELLQLKLKKRAADGGSYTKYEYDRVALGKTGHLFGLSLAISSLHFVMPEGLTSDWQKLGAELGVAYQVKDDFEDAQKESQEINYALLLAYEKWGGSPFRQISADDHKAILAWQTIECEARRLSLMNLLGSIETKIALPRSADQTAALETLKDMIVYVTSP